jgi:hypothetical protein
MALPPTIPTSFVPHAASAPARKFRGDITGAFGFFAYAVLGVVFALALGVFFYGRYLTSNKAAKDTALASAQAGIDPMTVKGFVRLRDRLNSSQSLLSGHPAFSNFFSTIEKLLPASVRFTTLHLTFGEGGIAKIEGAGIAKSFNALAAASNAFATDGRIKEAIFSNISVNRDSSVSFALSAALDPKLVEFSPTDTAGNVSAPAPASTAPSASGTSSSVAPTP